MCYDVYINRMGWNRSLQLFLYRKGAIVISAVTRPRPGAPSDRINQIPSERKIIMTVGVCGLGLIGGSFAKAYSEFGGITVYGKDIDESIESFACLTGAINGVLSQDTVPLCDIIFVALYPEATIKYMREIAPLVRRDAIVMDLCGIKESVCEVGFELAKQYGFTFVGGHPMAGTQYSGFKYAKAKLFRGASLIVVPPSYDDIELLARVKRLTEPLGLGRITVSSAREHDIMIAFTSQLAHVVSNAYVKSPTAQVHKGFSAGSYRDLTRVAWLNPGMWAELFLENREFVLSELDTLITALTAYRTAVAESDSDTLITLLEEGKRRKEMVDG